MAKDTDDARFSFGIDPVRDPVTGCLVFMGTLTSSGYPLRAHRDAVGAQKGDVVDHVYDHGCRYRCCIEPSHLEIVTPEENALRATAARRDGHRTWDRRALLARTGQLPKRWQHLTEMLLASYPPQTSAD